MASLNFNPFGNWFNKPQNPIAPINLHSITQSFLLKQQNPSARPNFAAINLSSLFGKPKKPDTEPKNPDTDPKDPETDPEEPPEKLSLYEEMFYQYIWECENQIDHRHTPQVEEILKRKPYDEFFEEKENPTEEEIKENEEWMKEFESDPVVKFLARAEEIADHMNEVELKRNSIPYRLEDMKEWQAIPHVIGLDGRPMPRKSIKTKKESDNKFWDFYRQFLFGLWGFQQRPYPRSKPCDIAQAIGYKRLEKRYYDFIMRSGGFWYKDRLGRTRGPCELIQLKTAWGAGIIDKDTFIWGEDLDEWAPIHMIYGMERAIVTWEVRLGAAATAFLHKLQKGIPPWVPLKGQEIKTYKQAQEEAYEDVRRDKAVLEANGGVWPGMGAPSHALFLWASGPELTSVLEKDHMPNKYIPKWLRNELRQIIPGLRPWEVRSVEEAMSKITYDGEWYREPLGTYTTGPPYIRHWNKDVMRIFKIFNNLSTRVYDKLDRTIPGFSTVMEKVQTDAAARDARRKERRMAQKKAEEEKKLYDRVMSRR